MSSKLTISGRTVLPSPVTAARAWPAVRTVVRVVGFCLLIALGAQVRIPLPLTPVPMTLQWVMVLLAGFTLSPSRAVAATGLYLLCGAAGAPFFAAGSLGVFGPTGGYLIGFVAGAWVISAVRGGAQASTFRLVVAGAAGTVVLFALGIAGGALWFRAFDPGQVVAAGLVPFVPKEILELALVVTLVQSWRGLRGSGQRCAGKVF